jgi:hypothetical protein
MITRKYHSSIRLKHPENYFERWYTDVWRRRFWENPEETTNYYEVIGEELAKIGAVDMAPPDNAYFELLFKDEVDYTMFVLKWA